MNTIKRKTDPATPHFLRRLHARLAPRPRKSLWRRVVEWFVQQHECDSSECPMCDVPYAEPDWSMVPGVWVEGLVFWAAVVPAGSFVEVCDVRRGQHAIS